MEHHKGPVKVQGRQSAHHQEDSTQRGRGPESGTSSKKTMGASLFSPAPEKQDHKSGQGQYKYPQVQEEQPPHIGKMAGPGG